MSGVTTVGSSSSGDVVGPSSSGANNLVAFNSTTGKIVLDPAIAALDVTGSLITDSWGANTPAIIIDATTSAAVTAAGVGIVSKGVNGGFLVLATQDSSGSGTTNGVTTITGSKISAASGNTGQILANTGNANTGNSGKIRSITGASSVGNTGAFEVVTGNASSGDSGSFTVNTGTATGTRGSATFTTGKFTLASTLLVSTQSSGPTIAVNANAGTGATATLGTGSTDVAGSITLTPAVVGLSTGVQCTVTFNKTYPNGTFVSLTPADPDAAVAEATLGVYVTSNTTTFDINVNIALTATTAYVWNYHVIGR